ncbi:MAG: crossover junction endodeoxyribonuclease RuvC [Thermodesulfovibrionia bacterium]|nr:crossover junction endodeoxyribonuclease RuvC [Thermodesulfovibrionia bacterium]
MRVIGIDPGTICCGYGIVESGVRGQGSGEGSNRLQTPNSELIYITSGEVRMNKKDTLPERLKALYDSLKATINEYKPAHLCIEKIFYHKSIRAAFALGSTRGVAMLLAAENNIPVFEYNSTELKMALTGYGRAEKQQVKEMVIRILNLHPPVSPLTKGGIEGGLSEDMTDALALCICHINTSMFKSQISSTK